VRYSWFRAVVAHHWRVIAVATCVAGLVIAAALVWSRPATPVSKSAGQLSVGYAQVSALRGRPVVVNFWSSSCGPCQKESPAIAQVARAVGDRVSFVGIDTADLRNAAIAFVKKSHVTYNVAYDPQGNTASRYRVPALPETFFLARSGKQIVGLQLGALTTPRLTAILHRLYGV
jgi:thiol-disulfide isomerase/thioredoxin